MRTLFYSTTSDRIKELSAITKPNQLAYCERHRYAYRLVEMPQYATNPGFSAEAALDGAKEILSELDTYDVIGVFDADILITNRSITIESIIGQSHVVASHETHGPCRINWGAWIIRSTEPARAFLRAIIGSYPIWKNYPFISQQWISLNLGYMNPDVVNSLTVLPTSILASSPWEAGSAWKPGAFLIHFMGFPIPQKVFLAKEHLKNYPL